MAHHTNNGQKTDSFITKPVTELCKTFPPLTTKTDILKSKRLYIRKVETIAFTNLQIGHQMRSILKGQQSKKIN